MKKRQGSAYILVIIVFLAVAAYSALMLHQLNNSVANLHSYSLQMQAYYLNHEAQEAVVAALLADDNDILENMPSYELETTITHDYASGFLGECKSSITLKKEKHLYYGTNTDWAVAYVTTEIPNPRANAGSRKFTYSGTVMVLVENPIIQLYNISPDTL